MEFFATYDGQWERVNCLKVARAAEKGDITCGEWRSHRPHPQTSAIQVGPSWAAKGTGSDG